MTISPFFGLSFHVEIDLILKGIKTIEACPCMCCKMIRRNRPDSQRD